MLKTLNTLLIVAEILFIALPLSVLSLLGGAIIFPQFMGTPHPDTLGTAIALVVSYIGLFGFWGMSLTFLISGAAGIRKASPVLWMPMALGMLATLSFVLRDIFPSAKAFFVLSMFGLPLWIPILHIALCVVASHRMRDDEEAAVQAG
ncbi:hypothetical protein [Variovorax sp. GB1P17]|uniref:hypothetical protein n=1 Tax=Variovorax sp. GB1P17 TaxID=3443740 RepID=UPI003F45E470